MNDEKLSALLSFIAPRIIQFLMDRRETDNKQAAKILYNSELYAMLEIEESKLWHLSAQTLYTLLEEELSTGKITYPEEA
jgi:hypothetical protein